MRIHENLSCSISTEGSATARLDVRDFEIHWISDFRLDFWISKWISGFQSGFLDFTWISTFWILFEELLFVILKILLINKPSQPGCTQNTMSQALHSSPRRTAYCVHNV